jgi:hypothetical protein
LCSDGSRWANEKLAYNNLKKEHQINIKNFRLTQNNCKISRSDNKPKTAWQTINARCGKSSFKPPNAKMNSQSTGINLTSHCDIAEALNNYFISSVPPPNTPSSSPISSCPPPSTIEFSLQKLNPFDISLIFFFLFFIVIKSE